MTLIVGIKCQDGIVLGGDGAATYTTPLGQSQTIKQPHPKLCIIGEAVILGVSGPVGLGQSYRAEIEAEIKNRNNRPSWKTISDARSFLHEKMWKHAGQAWKNAGVVAETVGPGPASQSAVHQSLVAFPVRNGPCLLLFDHQCQAEEATEHLPFLTVGSGQPAADPFLAFVRRVFWEKTMPSVDEGIFAATWTLEHCIEAQPGGIAHPIQIVTLRKDGNKNWGATQLSDDELGEHKEMINTVMSEMRNACKSTAVESTTSPLPDKL